jgi:hypothetical protein
MSTSHPRQEAGHATAAEEDAVCAEGAALLEFWAPKAGERRIEVAAPTG